MIILLIPFDVYALLVYFDPYHFSNLFRLENPYGSLAVLKRNSCDEILFAETYTNDKKISKSVHCAPNFGQNYSAFFRTEINNVNFFIKMKKILRPLFHFSLFLTFSGALYALSLNYMKYQLLITVTLVV